MSIANLLLRMRGTADPRMQLADAMAGDGAAQGAPAGASGGAGTAGAGGAQAAPVPPSSATASPPDLAALYQQIVQHDQRTNAINSGARMVAAGFAQEENRDRIMNSGSDQDSTNMVTNMLALRSTMAEQEATRRQTEIETQARQQMMSSLPAIAERTGIPLSELQILANTGKLGEFLDSYNERPSYTASTDAATGQTVFVNPNDPNATVGVGGAKPTEYKPLTDGTGQTYLYDPANPNRNAPVGNPSPPDRTTDIQNYEYYVQQERQAGREPKSMEVWANTGKQSGSGSGSIVDAAGNPLPNPPSGYTYLRGDDGKVLTDPESGTPRVAPIANGPEDTRVQDGARRDQLERQADDVITAIDSALSLMEDNPTTVAGPLGLATQYIPGHASADFAAHLETVRSNLGFDKLQEMRENSPTGGALGQVSDFENRLLQSTVANLSRMQSGTQQVAQLQKVRRLYNRIIHEGIPEAEAAELLRAEEGGGSGGGSNIDDLLKLYQ